MLARGDVKALLILTFVLISVVTGFSSLAIVAQAQGVKGPKTDVIIFKAVPLDQAAAALRSGDIDYYIYALRPAQAEALIGVSGIKLYNAPAGINSFVLNPAPDPKGLNPFSIREVRFAVNYLINREYIVTTILKGLAAPMYCHLSPYDPDYTVVYDIIAKYEFKYNPSLANTIITKALTEAGAEKVGGKWYYNGSPIRIKFVIRVEDHRKELGDMLASELERLGFEVERLYMTFREAPPTVYATNPADFKWHIYTEGWGKGAPEKYDYSTINQFYAPWYAYMPGWQEPTFWNYENKTIDELGQRIYKGAFTSKEERDELYRKVTEMGIQEAVRIFVVTTLDTYAARTEVKGLTLDLGAGLRSIFNPREAYVEGRNTLRVGHLWVWTEGTAWNPIGGFQDVYSVDIYRAVYDPWVWRNPFNGLPIPFRVTYTVETAGPKGTLKVPSDAFLWDAKTRSWKYVGDGVTAVSKVTFDLSKFVGAKWHYGQTITWADVLYPIYQLYDITYNESKASLEGSVAATYKELLPMFKGFRVVGGKYLEVYIDYWHFDENYIADMAVLTSVPNPWEVMFATDLLVFNDQKYGYSETTAEKLGVPWLSLVLKGHAEDVKKKLMELRDKGVIPKEVFTLPNGTSYITVDDALKRYDAAIKWIDTYGHAEISNGPYYVYAYDPANQYCELRAFRDATYPFSPGDWYFGEPERVGIVSVGIPSVVPGGDAQIIVDLKGPSPLHVKYLIKDPVSGEVLTFGSAGAVAPDRFLIQLPSALTSQLRPGGIYEVTIIGYSDQSALLTAEKHFLSVLNIQPIQSGIAAVASQMNASLKELSTSFDERIKALSGQIATLSEALPKILDTVSGGFKNLSNVMASSVSDLGKSLTQTVESASKGVKDDITKQVTTLSEKIDDLSASQRDLAAAISSLNTAIYALAVLMVINIVVTLLIGRRR